MQDALERALCELVSGPPLDLSDARIFAHWLERNGVTGADAEALRATDPERLLTYRRLVQFNLRGTMELAFPRGMARLGGVFDEYFARFVSERGSHSHYLRDVSYEFLDWSAAAMAADSRIASYLPDLMRHEALRVEIGALPTGSVRELGALDLERGVHFIEAARVVRYHYAVHELPDDVDDRSEPRREPTALFVYRSPEHVVRYLALSPLAAAILEGLHGERRTLREAVTGACMGLGCELGEEVLLGVARLLADLAERGALQGSVPFGSK